MCADMIMEITMISDNIAFMEGDWAASAQNLKRPEKRNRNFFLKWLKIECHICAYMLPIWDKNT